MDSARRVALATCAQVRDGDPDDAPVIGELAGRGVDAQAAVWDDAGVDWSQFALVVIRSTWDYALRREEFLAWARSVPRLANSSDILRWNTDKRYLGDLDRAGVPVVPTTFVEPGHPFALPSAGEFVVKPAIGAGGRDTARYTTADAELAAEHVAALHADGRTAMIQPYVADVDSAGESSLLYLGGTYSHSVRKGPLLTGSNRQVDGLYREETITVRTVEPAELGVAAAALAAVPGGPEALLFARVDLLPGPQGTPLLLELELTEPSLFLAHEPTAVERLADAIATAAAR